jgi:plasmid stabilization system protein ParE
MKSGYNILWTDNALHELAQTIEYIQENFSDKEVRTLALKIENTTKLISQNPTIFPISEFKGVYKAVVLKYNTLYYRLTKDNIEILSFFSNRQNPKKRKL